MTIETVGFIGLGVMGEPMCRNLAAKCGRPVIAHDIDSGPLERLAAAGVVAAGSVAGVAEGADLIFLSLPGGPELQSVVEGPEGLLATRAPGRTVVDTSTSPVTLTREIAGRFAAAGVDYADAPIARTRAAAEAGTLSIMVGGSAAVFDRVRPFLDCCAAEVTHCGAVGAGQVVKLMNNMVLFQTVVALSEALAVGRRAGVEGAVLFETLAKGSADSFALRNHGMKSILPGTFPERAFPVDYARKDLSYALALAAEMGVETVGAEAARAMLDAASEAGHGARYFPALFNVVDGESGER
jgi:3-hydroxyisobutyrate dehydrogenase-like beta-hydroxyacid dehydrogenase